MCTGRADMWRLKVNMAGGLNRVVSQLITRVIYYTGVPNIGDLANADVISHMAGAGTIQAADLGATHILAIGSTLDSAAGNSLVWGAGMMAPARRSGGLIAGNVFALRGKLTAAALRKQGLPIGNVPLGDPGVLLPDLMGIQRALTPRARLGIVPHYIDRMHPEFVRLRSMDGVRDLNVHETSAKAFLSAMAECEAVVSSSLHGLIFAEALGIPNLWAEVGDGLPGGRFKFLDWFTCTRQPLAHPCLLRQDTVLSLLDQARLHGLNVDQASLMNAFPHDRLAECQFTIMGEFLGHVECRRHPLPIFVNAVGGDETLRGAIGFCKDLGRSTMLVACGERRQRCVELALEIGLPTSTCSPDGTFDRNALLAFYSGWAEPGRYCVIDGAGGPHAEKIAQISDQALNEHPDATEAVVESTRYDRARFHRAGLFDIPSKVLTLTL